MKGKSQGRSSERLSLSDRDRERCAYIGNELVVACRYCDQLHRHPVSMERESLNQVIRHFELFPRCRGCGRRLLDIEWRKLNPRKSELEAMKSAARWMVYDRGGRAPTCQELWQWLEHNPAAVTDEDGDSDEPPWFSPWPDPW
jgi:hypothetical protein